MMLQGYVINVCLVAVVGERKSNPPPLIPARFLFFSK